MDCYCDFDSPTFYHVSLRTARKSHACDECRGQVEPGERYERAYGKWDGLLSYFKTCPRCLALRQLAQDNVPCFCLLHGNVREDAMEIIQDIAHEVPGLLFKAWRLEIAICRRESAMAAHRRQ